MARPREFDKDNVIQKVAGVFWEKGFEATTMSDLAEAAEVQRGSLYNAFGDKRQLYLEALSHYGEREYGGAAERLRELARKRGAKKALHEFYKTLAEKVAAGYDRRGCLICNACTERAAQDKRVKELVEHYISVLQTAIVESLSQDTRLELKQTEAKALAESFTATYLGFRIWTKAGLGAASIKRSAAATLKVLEP